MSLQAILIIGTGGFIGTILRYLCGQMINTGNTSGFPFATLMVNLLGCFAIGVAYGYFEKHAMAVSDWKNFLTIGVCGGFTTFSAFSLENLQLMRDGNYGLAILYIFISVVFGLGLSFAGLQLFKS